MLVDKGISIKKTERLLYWGGAVFALLTIGTSLWILISYAFFDKPLLSWNRWVVTALQKKSDKPGVEGSLEALGLSKKPYAMPMPEIEKHLFVLDTEVRPDLGEEKGAIVLALEGGSEKRLTHLQEKVYLSCSDENTMVFAEEKTPFWVEVVAKEAKDVTFVLHTDYHEEGLKFTLREGKELSSEREIGNEIAPLMTYLEKVKIYDGDRLIDLYGGKSFTAIKGLYRLWDEKRGPIFLKVHDRFVWRGGELEQNPKETEGLPLCLVRSLSNGACEMVLWDSKGLYGKQITLPIIKHVPPLMKPHEMFPKLQKRTETSVTCEVHNRNMILRKGDWVLFSKGQIRNLRTFDEVKAVLRYALKGELFIFDEIVKKEDKTLFLGHLFNEERSVVKQIEIPIGEQRKERSLVAPKKIRAKVGEG